MNNHSKIRLSGNASYKIEVPYKLLETGKEGPKPLIIYLHGYNQNLDYFAKKVASLRQIKAYHLFVQGPYPIYDEKHQRKVEQWGRAWYLYDGTQEQFIKSMEETSTFIEDLTNYLRPQINVNKIAIMGYSMGGYLAGYFALSRPRIVTDLIVIGGRIKTEYFTDHQYPELNVLALHGSDDQTVAAQRQKESCDDLEKLGAAVKFKAVKTTHRLNDAYIDEVREWLKNKNYKISD